VSGTRLFGVLLIAIFLMTVAPGAFAADSVHPVNIIYLFGIPLDFILFAATLLGVALFHHHTLKVALTGVIAITLYKVFITGFKTGPHLMGLVGHLGHEWVTLANLFGLLMGFALLSKHFEDSHVPDALPRILPDDWKGGFVLLVMVFVISSFLDNIAAALIGGTMAHAVFRGKVHIGYLAAIVAASNAGGSGSVVGDTTTTMMWIDGVRPIEVLHAYVAAGVALIVCGIPASLQQQKFSPIYKIGKRHVNIDYARVGIVAFILISAVVVNVVVNTQYAAYSDIFPFLGATVWVAILLCVPIRQPDWSLLPSTFKGTLFLLSLVLAASMMPVEQLPAPSSVTVL
jgi:Na+/H+ antiporter NhaD/arsenite permease-like protein